MKKGLFLAVICLAAGSAGAEEKALARENAATAADTVFQTEDQKVLYALGAALGQNIASFNLTAEEVKFVNMGLADSVKGKLLVDYNTYGPKISQLARTKQEAAAQEEKKKAKPFLEKAAREKGAVTAKSGLIYKEIKKGTGASPSASDTVKVHYHGTLMNGTVFDSSVQRDTPATFPLNGVIPCWTEGVQKMKVGGKAKLVCPASIAYGDSGRPPQIPGGTVLTFEVELLDIVKK